MKRKNDVAYATKKELIRATEHWFDELLGLTGCYEPSVAQTASHDITVLRSLLLRSLKATDAQSLRGIELKHYYPEKGK